MSGRNDKRHVRLQRLVAAVRQLRNMEELQVRQAQARLQALQRQRDALLGALGRGALARSGMTGANGDAGGGAGGGDAFGIGGDMAVLLRRNLDATAREEARLQALMQEREERLRQRRAQERQVLKLQQRTQQALRRSRHDAALAEVVEQILRRDDGASS